MYICLSIQAASNTKNLDVGANVFIGNLDPEIDEKLLYDIFSAFGVILQTPKVNNYFCCPPPKRFHLSVLSLPLSLSDYA